LKEASLDFNFQKNDILKVVMALTPADLDQTMPSHLMPGLWQDVYKKGVLVNDKVVMAYIKLQIVEDIASKVALVISFHRT
jgi:Motility quorum-sensing regulator, toxin of MqsA